MLVSAPVDQRYDVTGAEVLQIRGTVVDDALHHPQVVVRFSGPRRAELYRWAKPGKHLSVDGMLEVKSWMAAGQQHLALLIEAQSLFPLSDADSVVDPSKAGIYAIEGRAGKVKAVEQPSTLAGRVEKLRDFLASTDA